jgi:hypothetical protein
VYVTVTSTVELGSILPSLGATANWELALLPWMMNRTGWLPLLRKGTFWTAEVSAESSLKEKTKLGLRTSISGKMTTALTTSEYTCLPLMVYLTWSLISLGESELSCSLKLAVSQEGTTCTSPRWLFSSRTPDTSRLTRMDVHRSFLTWKYTTEVDLANTFPKLTSFD